VTKLKTLCLVACLTVAASGPAFAGKFRSAWGGFCKVDVKVPEPPVAYIGKKSAKILVTSTVADVPGEQLRVQIEQALAPDIIATDPSPEAIFKVAVIGYNQPKTKQYTLSERFRVKVGDRPVYNKDGTQKVFLGVPVTEPIYEDRVLPVAFWEGDASLNVEVGVESSSGAHLDAFNPQANFNEKIKTSVGNESTPEAGQIPDNRQILNRLTGQIVGQIRKRYARTERLETVMLAIDDELKAGNAMAQAGKWDEALKQWESVKMKKNESDRLYNMAAANEMLAYTAYRNTQNMEASFPLFSKALAMYEEALKTDPTEKYIQQAQARIMRAKTNMDTAMKHYEAQRFEAEKLEHEIEAKRQKEQEIASSIERGAKGGVITPDSPDEAKFRTYARARLGSVSGDPSDDQINAMLNAGKELYNIENDPGKQVIYEEIGRKRRHDQGLRLYRESLADFAKEKQITADARSSLKDIREKYALSESETAQIEQEFGITAPKKTVPPAAKVPAKPAPRPAVARKTTGNS
jgi:tetratricopeptide (TPR) repeat protein